MCTSHHLVKCQFTPLSVCFLLLASDNSWLGVEGVAWCRSSSCISGNGATPQLCMAHHTTTSHQLQLCQRAQNNTHWCPQPAADAWHRSPTGSSRHVSALPRHTSYCYRFPLLSKTCRNTHTELWHNKELQVVPIFYDILWPWGVKFYFNRLFNVQRAVKKKTEIRHCTQLQLTCKCSALQSSQVSFLWSRTSLIVAVNCPHLTESARVSSSLSLSCHHFGVLRNQARYLHIIMMICIQIDAYQIDSLYYIM